MGERARNLRNGEWPRECVPLEIAQVGRLGNYTQVSEIARIQLIKIEVLGARDNKQRRATRFERLATSFFNPDYSE